MKNKTSILWTTLSVITSMLLLFAEGFTVFRIIKLDMIPVKYIVLIIIAMALISALLIFLLFWKKDQFYRTYVVFIRIIACILTVAITFGCAIGYDALSKLGDTFITITNAPVVSAQIGVYVLVDNPAECIEDAASYHFGYTDSYDGENTRTTLTELKSTLGDGMKSTNYENVFTMVRALYKGEVDAVVLNSAYADGILVDIEEFSDFSVKTKLLHHHVIVEVTDPTETQPPQETTLPSKTAHVEPFIIYLSGSDTRNTFLDNENYTSRSDVNILAAVNPKTKQILLVNTPRDYYIPNPEYDGALDKLTHCGLYGIDCSIQALSDLYEQPITYDAQINFTGFEILIDAIGGVTITSDEGDGVYLSEGDNYMDGELALQFARDRGSYADGDNARGRNQMMVISAVIDKMTDGSMITNYSDILDSLEGMFVTSVPNSRISALIKMQLSDMAHWDVFSYSVTGTGDSRITCSVPETDLYVMHPNYDEVEYASDLMGRVLDGKKISSKDIEKDVNE